MDAVALWMTGLPGSGKSTIAEGIRRLHPDFIVLRMDELRKVVTPEPAYSEPERYIVYRCLVYAAWTLVRNGHSVIIDATGNMRKWRDLARQLIKDYGEVYLRCPLETCMEREGRRIDTHGAPKEIYKKGVDGWPVPGVSAPYEEPNNPELVIETDKVSVDDSIRLVERLIKRLKTY